MTEEQSRCDGEAGREGPRRRDVVLAGSAAAAAGLAGLVARPSPAGAQAPGAAGQAARPHIIYILADDLGRRDVGFTGSDIRTPNIDRLASTGARFDQFYVQPMCTPTRAALLTGRYPMRYGLQTVVILPEQTYGLPTDEWLLPQMLKDAGYSTAIIGKWHLGHAQREFWPRQRGFDYHYGPLVGEIDYFTHTMHNQRDWYRNNEPVNEQGYVTTLLGEDAVRRIGAHDPNTPLFMYLAFTAPHTPYQVPQNYLDQYAHIPDPNRRAYAGMITAMDDQIGAVMRALEARGMRENTLVIFHSDNGGVRSSMFAGQIAQQGEPAPDNSPYRGGKGNLYEGGTRVCSLINWPGRIRPNTVVNDMVHVVDYYPTLARLAGATLGKNKPLDGFDIWPTISQGTPTPRREVVYNVEIFRGAVRQDDWKLFWRATLPSAIELFNLASDPQEANNVAAANPEKVQQLQGRISELASQMSRSLFMQAVFASVTRGGPMVLPDEEAFFEGDTP